MKIKDLPPKTVLAGVVFIHPETGEQCEWVSSWNAGVWWRKPGLGPVSPVFPIFLDDPAQALEWEIVRP